MIPLKLSLKNFISHSCSILDFRRFAAALLIGTHSDNPDISNGVGKTVLFDAIRWVLFSKSRFNIKTKVVKRGQAFCEVAFVFELSDGIYKIVRKFDVKSGITDVVFYKKENDKWEVKPYTGDTNTMTNNNIIEKIGINHDAFVNVVYFRQNDIAGFATAATSKRKDILKEILQIGVWDNLQEGAKDLRKKLKTRREILEGRINSLGNLEREKKENENKIKDITLKLEDVNKTVSFHEEKIFQTNEEISTLGIAVDRFGNTNHKTLTEKLDDVFKKSKKIKERKAQLTQSIKHNNNVLVTGTNECLVLERKLVDLSKDVLIVAHKTREEAESIFKKLASIPVPVIQHSSDNLDIRKAEYQKHQRAMDLVKLQLKQLLSLEPGAECPTCLTNLKNKNDVMAKRKTKRIFLEKRVSNMINDLNELEIVINEEQGKLDKANESSLEIQRVGLIIAKHRTSINEATRHNEEIQAETLRLIDEWNALKELKKRTEELLEKSKNLGDAEKELDIIYNNRKKYIFDLENTRKKVIEFNIRLGNLEGHAEELVRKKSEQDILVAQRDSVSFDIEAYSGLSRVFGKDGIQAIIMENVTEDLKAYANSILQEICSDPMTIDFVTQKQTGTGNWKESFDISILTEGVQSDFEDLSGGEKVRIAFALRLALSRLLMRRVGSNIRFLLLDEIDQSLDKRGVDVLAEVVHTLSNEFKVLVITHNDLMKDRFEDIITVQKQPGGSVLRQ